MWKILTTVDSGKRQLGKIKDQGLRNWLIGFYFWSVLRIWFRDPGSGHFLTPGSGIRMNIPDHFSESLEIKYLNSLMRIWIRDLFGPGSGIRDRKIRIRIWYKLPRYATMLSMKVSKIQALKEIMFTKLSANWRAGN
jgi:hypothetical protein